MRQQEYRKKSRLLRVAARLEFQFESFQVGIINDTKIEILFQGLAGLMFTDGVIRRQKRIEKLSILVAIDD